MRESIYKAARLNIFEKQRAGVITESQRDELFAVLEKEKEESEMTKSKAMDLLDEMKETFPNLSDDIEKLSKKFDKADKDDDSDGGDDDGGSEEGGDDEGEEEVSEAFQDLLNTIHNL